MTLPLQYILEADLSCGYDPALGCDYDFQDFDEIIRDELGYQLGYGLGELGYSIADSPNAKWKRMKKFPWRFERVSDKKKAWANRKGFDELVKTKKFKFLAFDKTLATDQQKKQWKELSALLAKLGPAPAPSKPSANSRWSKTNKFPWRFERVSDKKKAWANRKGFDELVKTKKYKFLGFDAKLATDTQKKQWKELAALLAKLGPAPTPKAPAPAPGTTPSVPHSGTKWSKTKKFPFRFERVSDKKKIWANKPGFDYLVKTGKFKFLGFDDKLATDEQKKQWKKIAEALKKLEGLTPKQVKGLETMAQEPVPHSGAKWKKTTGYPWVFARLTDQRPLWTNRPGFDYIVKTKQYKFTRFDDSLASDYQKQQWVELGKLLSKLPPPGSAAMRGLEQMALRGTQPRPMAPPQSMVDDIKDIKKMLQLEELQRQATHEHEEKMETQSFRRQVLDRLMRIADAVLASDSPLYRKISTAYNQG